MIKISVLSENHSISPDFLSEHGLSLLIETDEQKILFDTGASGLFMENAKKMQIDLDNLDAVVLSHGHYDHTGGLAFLKNKKVYIHPDLFIPKYKKSEDDFQYIGTEFIRCYYEHNNRLLFQEISAKSAIAPNVFLISGFEPPLHDDYFYIKPLYKDNYLPDYFTDETVMVLSSIKGLIVITGCAHSGVKNILDKVRQIFPGQNIYALIGGLHLSKCTDREVRLAAGILREYKVGKVIIGHCTGTALEKYLEKDQVLELKTGKEIIL